MADPVRFERRLGLSGRGAKPELFARIKRRLLGQPDADAINTPPKGQRDSIGKLTRTAPVVRYKSDALTRAFFKSQLGPGFHFTYRLTEFRRSRTRLTCGDLIDEWAAEQSRRRAGLSGPTLTSHGKYNRFVRDFFADSANAGRTLKDAVTVWNAVKNRARSQRYERRAKD